MAFGQWARARGGFVASRRHSSLYRSTALATLLLTGTALQPAYGQTVSVTGDVVPGGATSPIWDVGGSLRVGDAAEGSLTIEGGGTVTNDRGYIGFYQNGIGTVLVTGLNSRWENSGTLRVGHNGAGLLAIEDGGTVTSDEGSIGYNQLSSGGTVTVSGSGSLWENSNELVVGWDAAGTLVIEDGGTVTTSIANIGRDAGGNVKVSGPDSLWDIEGELNVGFQGPSTLTIEKGGRVASGGASIGLYDRASGSSVTVSGMDASGNVSAWVSSGDIVVGNEGSGTLTVSDGGEVLAGNGSGALLLGDSGGTGTINIGTATGPADAEAGTIEAATVKFGDGDSTLNFNHTGSTVFSAALVSAGTGTHTLNHMSGTTTLTGDNSAFAGTTNLSGGTLIVGDVSHPNASLAGDVTVNAGATLGGIGTLGATIINVDGIHAPGNSPGTQTIVGDYVNHGTLQIDVTPTDHDQLVVDGTVDISGAKLELQMSPETKTDWDITTGPYTIINNTGADDVVGEFVSPAKKNLVFLDETLDYFGGDGNDVTLELTRNDVDFTDVGRTRNQKAAAGGVEGLGSGNPVWNAVALQTDEDAIRAAFDALSGEIHASAKTALIEGSHFIRDAVTNRIRSAFGDAATGTDMPLLGYGPDGIQPTSPDSIGAVAWGHAFGSWVSFDGDGNAASMDTSTGGFLTGIDGAVADNVRVGLLAGYSHSSFNVGERTSSGSSDNYHLGLYAGAKRDALRLSGGLAYTWHDIETNRSVAFPGFSDRLESGYNAGTFQVFGEAGYHVDTANGFSFEPFANLAYVSLHTDGFTEDGGAGALHVHGETTDATFTTLGVHLSSAFDIGGMKAKAHGTLGWRHAFGDTTPLSNHAFAAGDAFTIAGVPIAQDAALVEAGLDLNLTDTATLGVSYQGQFGSGVTQNGFNASLNIRF